MAKNPAPLPQRVRKGIVKRQGSVKHSRRVSFDPLALLLDASLEGELELVIRTAGEVRKIGVCEGCQLIMIGNEFSISALMGWMTVYKRWSCYSGHKLLCKLCQTFPPPAMVARFTVFCGPSGWLALLTKADDVELIHIRQH